MRLIDADKMDVLEHLDYNYHPEKDGDAWYKAKDVWDCIDKEHTIDPESLRQHGRNDGRLRGVTYEDGKIITVLIIDTDDVVKVFEPVRHGRWVVRGQDIFCSECKCESGYNAFGASSFSDYCPNCGAIMDGDE